MIWRSVVGKLWLTIILLVAFVLLILTVLLLQFFRGFQVDEARDKLTQVASKVVTIVEEHDDPELARSIAFEIADDTTGVIIAASSNEYWMSESWQMNGVALHQWLLDSKLSSVLLSGETVSETTSLQQPQQPQPMDVMIIGMPAPVTPSGDGAVFVYQSLDVVQRTTEETTRLVLLSAGVAIFLTTIFAFFLSTRITAPLRKMREAAFEMARGEFDTKIPILTHDEIGELALAFNRMGRELQFHVNALNQEKEQLSSILSSMVDGVITLNRDGEVLLTNPPAKRFINTWRYENKAEELPPLLSELFADAVQNEDVETAEITIQGRIWVIIMAPLYDGSYVRGAVAVLRDMTDERKLDKLRTDFIANVSHELRTPISLLQGYSEAIVDDVAVSEQDKREVGKIIYEESLRMGRLVNELLDLARVEAGHVELNKNDVSLRTYFDRMIQKFNTLAQERDVQLKTDLHLTVDHFPLDEDRLEQVLTNLLDNAIRHTEAQGEVVLHAQATPKRLMIEVRDTGVGIPEEDLPFVFERFYKADKARTRGMSGTGLGLAISKNLVEAHQGTITVHSKQHEGTTFTVTFPHPMIDERY
ncbi:cell wall metabolism sensor histidine kinase WalK [Bacillaceae bacterium SIJ1]|uniref:ATP-binding protein n=1 Tax=Litoribacterium kuwaitense TaxID=1398745 RepID=UPI0013EDB51F|nr:ATP-binding protein [Litoribacterium kuwaitense]NGP43671.1 cell wall metabolism sensor histidine kinase WalK [Litoribacterium kuwaitense]